MVYVLTGAVLITLLTHPSNGYSWGRSNFLNEDQPSLKPEFDEAEKDIVVSVGRTAFLPCYVKNIGSQTVSWIRTKDLHIITAGQITFTNDHRFSSANTGLTSPNWGLRLRNSQPSDSGTYECQVNTDPKMNRKVVLEVDENLGDSPFGVDTNSLDEVVRDIARSGPTTKILGQDEQFVHTGSTVTLTCLVIPGSSKISNVDWLKDGHMISFQASRGGISIITDRSDKRTTSSVVIADVTEQDSGNYSCKPQPGPIHSIQLLVTEGERSEAIQRFHRNSSPRSQHFAFLLIALASLAQLAVFTRFTIKPY